jgi:phage terminase Nu1 subunit (DNA packaging protein)
MPARCGPFFLGAGSARSGFHQQNSELMMSDEAVSATELGQWLGCSARTVREYATQGIITQAGRGQFPLQASVSAVVAHLRDRAAGWTAESSDGGEALSPAAESAALNRAKRALTIEQTRKAAVQAQVAEAELQIVLGNLISREEVIEAWGLIITVAKSKIMSLATRLPTQIHGLNREEIAIIGDECRTILSQLAEDGEIAIDDVTASTGRRVAAHTRKDSTDDV